MNCTPLICTPIRYARCMPARKKKCKTFAPNPSRNRVPLYATPEFVPACDTPSVYGRIAAPAVREDTKLIVWLGNALSRGSWCRTAARSYVCVWLYCSMRGFLLLWRRLFNTPLSPIRKGCCAKGVLPRGCSRVIPYCHSETSNRYFR
jgi:hypothetical protein